VLEHLSEEQRTEETIKEELVSFIQAKELKNGQVLWQRGEVTDLAFLKKKKVVPEIQERPFLIYYTFRKKNLLLT